MDILNRIIANTESEVPLSRSLFDKLVFFEKEPGKWYLKSHDIGNSDRLVLNENNGKKYAEEVVRQLFLYELDISYGYPVERMKIEKVVRFGRESKKADIVVFQNDNQTPLIVCEIKAPHTKNDLEQLKSYLNAEGSPIGVGYNGKNITRLVRPYPREFEVLPDLPTEDEYQQIKDTENPVLEIKDLILNRKWTLRELKQLNIKKQFNLREKIETLEELVLGNSGFDSFDEIFKLIYAKLFDEFEAENRRNQALEFRVFSNPEVTVERIGTLFDGAKDEWRGVFEDTDRIKLRGEHLETVVGELTEIELRGANLRIIDEAFEYLVPEVSKTKKGQFFTPRVVIDACVKMINPSRREYVLDPACGSAGFLLHAMQFVTDRFRLASESQRRRYAGKYLWGIDFEEKTTKISRALMLISGDGRSHIYKENTLDYRNWNSAFIGDLRTEARATSESLKDLLFDVILSNPPFAGEITEKSLVNDYLDILGLKYSVNIDYAKLKDLILTLGAEFHATFEDSALDEVKREVSSINKDAGIDLELDVDSSFAASRILSVLTTRVGIEPIPEHILETKLRTGIKYRRSQSNWNKVERHILFIQRIVNMLKPGGRSVIVLPQGIFNNADTKFVRNYVLNNARILGVIGLHGNSFKPHTGTKTSLMILRKYTKKELKNARNADDFPIFFASSKVPFKDSSGNYLFVRDGEGNPVLDSSYNAKYQTDLFDIADAFVRWGQEQLTGGDSMFDFLRTE